MNIAITGRDLTGLDPTVVLGGLYALTVMSPPRRIEIRLRNGPALAKASPIPSDFMEIPAQSLEICEALATIQKHSYLPVRIPDLAKTLVSEVNEWLLVARLLRGDAIELSWEDIHVQVHQGTELSTDAFTVATADKLSVTVGELAIDLGYKMYHLEAARVDTDDPDPREGLTRLIPAGSDRGTVRWWGMTPPDLESS